MKKYFISGIWTSMANGQPVVTHVMLHDSDSEKNFKSGKKVDQNTVIKLLKIDNALIYTIEWSYTFKEWQKGAAVSFEKINETECLVTKKDDKLINNLATLLPMKVLTAKSKMPAVIAL